MREEEGRRQRAEGGRRIKDEGGRRRKEEGGCEDFWLHCFVTIMRL
jgi:hypothetical protein